MRNTINTFTRIMINIKNNFSLLYFCLCLGILFTFSAFKSVDFFDDCIPETTHQEFDQLLQKYVAPSGAVNYLGFKKEIVELDSYLKTLSKSVPSKASTNDEKLAYWMNAYNAFTIKLVVNKYPVSSIKDISSKPWDIKFIKLGDKTYSLNDIEHEILRKMNDPRIHVGINCASVSCPKLSNRAFTAANVNGELNKLVKGFLMDKSKNRIKPDEIAISKIFSWFRDDFTKKGTLIDWINKYANNKVKSTAKVSYLKYDWNLNK